MLGGIPSRERNGMKLRFRQRDVVGAGLGSISLGEEAAANMSRSSCGRDDGSVGDRRFVNEGTDSFRVRSSRSSICDFERFMNGRSEDAVNSIDLECRRVRVRGVDGLSGAPRDSLSAS